MENLDPDTSSATPPQPECPLPQVPASLLRPVSPEPTEDEVAGNIAKLIEAAQKPPT